MSSDPPYLSVGHQLRERRDELDLTQGDLAQRIGIRPESVSATERGKNKIMRSKRAVWEKALSLKPGTISRAYEAGTALEVSSEVGTAGGQAAPARPQTPTNPEILATGLSQETKEALLSMRRQVARWVAAQEERKIQQGARHLLAIEDDDLGDEGVG